MTKKKTAPIAGLKTETVTVTASAAAKMLEKANASNRHVSDIMVARYAADMSAKRWMLTHQGIAVGPDGTILDGHHRLEACVKSGASFQTQITYYPSQDAYRAALLAVDKGRPRSTGNVLELLGHVPPGRGTQVAAIVLALDALEHNGTRAMSVDMTLLAYIQHKSAIDWAIDTLVPMHDFPSHIRAAAAFAYKTHPREVAAFAKLVTSQAGLVADTGAHKFVKAIKHVRSGGSRQDRYDSMRMTLRCIAGHIRGEKMRRVYPSDDGLAFFLNAAAGRSTKKAA